MTLEFNVNGKERKNLVEAVSTLLETPFKYLGAPSFAYQVGEYHIDKNGTLSGIKSEWLVDMLHQNGFRVGERTYNSHEVEEETDFDDKDTEVEETEESPTFEELPLTIEVPLDGFSPEKLDNLCKMVTAKEALLKAALGAETLPIQVREDSIRFPWFRNESEITADETNAYATLISLLCETAREKKRVTAKAGEMPANPKFAFRCFLLSLGMIGDEYKMARKILLSKLGGNSAWKGGPPLKAEHEVIEEAAETTEA